MVRIVAQDHVVFIVDSLDRRVRVNAAATIIEPGETAARCVSLAGVLAGLRPDQAVRLVRDDDDIVINAGRSRFRIPGLPLERLPQSAELQRAMVEFALDVEHALHLVEATAYAASDEETRYYLNGVYLHSAGTTTAPTLRGVATDGHRLAQVDLLLPAGAKDMPGVIIPNKTIAIIAKLLKRKHVPESITLQISDRLLELSLPDVKLTSKLIDGTFPDYERIIPRDYSCSVIVDRTELGAALARVEATLDPEIKKLMRTVRLAWGDSALHVIRTGADVDDVLNAETSGTGKTALRISYIADVLDVFSGKRISIASCNGEPIRFADPADPTTFSIVMPVHESGS
jgi:DNA polymerase III subunit beta